MTGGTPSFLRLLSVAVKAAPEALLQPPAEALLGLMRRRHPRLFRRLPGGGRTLLVEPTDLAARFLFVVDPDFPSVKVLKDAPKDPPAARVAGPFRVLIALLEGRADGDALFFSRDLVIEGDTELVVALRNGIEGAEIDLDADLLSLLGPFEQIAGPILPHLKAARERLLKT